MKNLPNKMFLMCNLISYAWLKTVEMSMQYQLIYFGYNPYEKKQ